MLSLFPRDVLDEIWELIESVPEGFPIYFCGHNFLVSTALLFSELVPEEDMSQDQTVSGLMLSLSRGISGKQYGYFYIFTYLFLFCLFSCRNGRLESVSL